MAHPIRFRSRCSFSVPNGEAGRLAAGRTDGDRKTGSGRRFSNAHLYEAGATLELTFYRKNLEEEDCVTHCLAEVLVLYAELINDTAPSVIHVEEVPRHRRS